MQTNPAVEQKPPALHNEASVITKYKVLIGAKSPIFNRYSPVAVCLSVCLSVCLFVYEQLHAKARSS